MVRRFGHERINSIHIGKSLVYFSDADSDSDPGYLKGKALKWDTVKKFYRSHVKQFVLMWPFVKLAELGRPFQLPPSIQLNIGEFR